jgi:hypothetical protein
MQVMNMLPQMFYFYSSETTFVISLENNLHFCVRARVTTRKKSACRVGSAQVNDKMSLKHVFKVPSLCALADKKFTIS